MPAKKTTSTKTTATKAAAKKPATKKAPPRSCGQEAGQEGCGEEAGRQETGDEGCGKKLGQEGCGEEAGQPRSRPRRLRRRSRPPRPAAKDTAPAAPKRTAKVKVPFKVGDKVVYPHHGAATIIKKERIDFGGEKQDYFVLEVATDQLTVRVPTTKAVELGVRPVISKNVARKVFATFKDDPQEAGSNWSRWYKLLTEKINSGDIFQVAEVVRDLTYAQQIKGISPALKRMLAKARLIIISELRFALNLEEEEAIRRLDRALPKVEEPDEL